MISIRPAEQKDCQMILDWRNDDVIRSVGLNTEVIDSETHNKWFKEKLASNETHIFIGMKDGREVGMVRFDLKAEKEFLVSIFVAPDQIGKGIGDSLLSSAEAHLFEKVGPHKLEAEVVEKNEAAQKLFIRNNYQESDFRYFKTVDSLS